MHSCNDAPKQCWQVSEQSSFCNSGTSRKLVKFWPKIDLAGVTFPTRDTSTMEGSLRNVGAVVSRTFALLV